MSTATQAPEATVDPRQAVLDAPKGYRVDAGAHERSMRDVHNPTLQQLVRHALRWGTDGILEAGMHLNDADFLALRELCVTTKGKRS